MRVSTASTDDVVAPPSECPEYVADMPVMVLVTEETGIPLVFLPVCLPRVILVPLGVALGVPLGNLEYGILIFTDPCKREYLTRFFLIVAIPPIQFFGLAEREE